MVVETLTNTMTLFVRDLPPSPNVTGGRHWTSNLEQKRHWRDIVYYLARANPDRPARPWHRAHIHFHISVGDKRRHDADNLIASMKHVQDGLIGVVIEDDSIDNIEVTYSFDRERPRGFSIAVWEI